MTGTGNRKPRRAQFDRVSLSFDTPKGMLQVVDDVSYDIHDGDFVASQLTTTLDLTHKLDVGLSEPLYIAGGLE